MAFDFKKEYKEFYLPSGKPQIVTVPKMQFVALRGKGDPNEEGGEYKAAIGVLYAVSYTIKMSKMGDRRIEGFFDFVVPPLEGFWWQDGVCGIDCSRKKDFRWISAIRLPDFVTQADFDWAKNAAASKKKIDCSRAEFVSIEEGLCVQCLHAGPFDDEAKTVAAMDSFVKSAGYENDFSDKRLHHEIYLSDARKVPAEKWRTVVRHPIRTIMREDKATQFGAEV